MENRKKNKKILKEEVVKKIEEKIDIKRLLFRIFDEPRPEYIAKVNFADKIIDKLFLWAIPQSVRPNYITLFRFISIPLIIWLLQKGFYNYATILFIISAFSDAIDGSIARIRNKITDWGIVFDPFADKLLIGVVGGVLIFKFLNTGLAIAIISIEFFLVASAYHRFKGEIVPAKTVGKIKMILQCLGVGFIFLFLVTSQTFFLTIASYILWLAVFFAILSLTVYRSI